MYYDDQRNDEVSHMTLGEFIERIQRAGLDMNNSWQMDDLPVSQRNTLLRDLDDDTRVLIAQIIFNMTTAAMGLDGDNCVRAALEYAGRTAGAMGIFVVGSPTIGLGAASEYNGAMELMTEMFGIEQLKARTYAAIGKTPPPPSPNVSVSVNVDEGTITKHNVNPVPKQEDQAQIDAEVRRLLDEEDEDGSIN